jgi:hypothetical protein
MKYMKVITVRDCCQWVTFGSESGGNANRKKGCERAGLLRIATSNVACVEPPSLSGHMQQGDYAHAACEVCDSVAT